MSNFLYYSCIRTRNSEQIITSQEAYTTNDRGNLVTGVVN